MRYGRRPVGIPVDQHARLRIDHDDGIAVEIGGIEQMPVGIESDVADEIARGVRLSAGTTGKTRLGVSFPSAKMNSKTEARDPPPT